MNIGLSLEEIAAIKEDPDAPNWNQQDRAVLRAVDEIRENSRISDATWTALARHFSRHQIMDLVFTIGHYVMLSWAFATMGIQLEDSVDQTDFDLKTASGALPVRATDRGR